MAKLIVQVRTRDNLLDLLARGESGYWVIAEGKESLITNIHIVNWDGTQRIEGIYDPASYRQHDKLVLKFFDAYIVNCEPPVEFDSRNPVRYVKKTEKIELLSD